MKRLTKDDINRLANSINLNIANRDKLSASQGIGQLYGYWLDFLNGKLDSEEYHYLDNVLLNMIDDFKAIFEDGDLAFCSVNCKWEFV